MASEISDLNFINLIRKVAYNLDPLHQGAEGDKQWKHKKFKKVVPEEEENYKEIERLEVEEILKDFGVK